MLKPGETPPEPEAPVGHERSAEEKELEQDLAWAWMAAGSAADRGCE